MPTPPKKPWELEQRTPHGKALKVGEIIDEYLLSPAYLNLSNSSKLNYQSTLRKFQALPLLNSKSIFYLRAYKIDYAMVDYIAKVLSYKYKAATVQAYFTVMSAVWNYAVRGGRVFANPWLKPGLKRGQERDVTWSNYHVTTFISKAKELGYNVLALYILLCYETAQRPWQDIRNLKWDNLKQVEDGKFVLDFTVSKTNTHLIIPLSDNVAAAVNAQPKTSPYLMVDQYGKHFSKSGLISQFNRVKKAAELPQNLKFRDLRRTAVTEMAVAGCSTLEIEAMTGWRCPDAVLRRYARVRVETAKHALQKREQSRIQQSNEVCGET